MNLKEDKNMVLIEGVYETSIFPETTHDLLKTIYVNEGAVIKGAIYGRSLYVKSNSRIWGEVFTKEKLVITHFQKVIFLSSIASTGAILSQLSKDEKEEEKEQLREYTLLIYGDVIGKIVNLENALIIGSVYADEIILRNTFTLGVINASEYVDLNNVVGFAFYSKNARHIKNITSIYPHSILDENGTPTESLRWLPFCMAIEEEKCPYEKIMCEKFIHNSCDRYVKLHSVDKLTFEESSIFTPLQRIVDVYHLRNAIKRIFDEYKIIFASSKIEELNVERELPIFSRNEKFLKGFKYLRKEWEKKANEEV